MTLNSRALAFQGFGFSPQLVAFQGFGATSTERTSFIGPRGLPQRELTPLQKQIRREDEELLILIAAAVHTFWGSRT